MKKLVIVLGVLMVGFGAFYLWSGGTPRYANYPPQIGRAWVAFGDSLTSGYGASEGNDYPTLLSKRLDFPILNMGTPGATTQDALATVDQVVKAQPRVVLLCFGGNDTLNRVPSAQTFENLGRVVDQLQQAGAFVVLIGVRSATVRDRYSGSFKQLARQKHVLLVPNILSGVLGDPRLMSDYVHPNDAGYAAIAERLEGVLRPLLPLLGPGPKPSE